MPSPSKLWSFFYPKHWNISFIWWKKRKFTSVHSEFGFRKNFVAFCKCYFRETPCNASLNYQLMQVKWKFITYRPHININGILDVIKQIFIWRKFCKISPLEQNSGSINLSLQLKDISAKIFVQVTPPKRRSAHNSKSCFIKTTHNFANLCICDIKN